MMLRAYGSIYVIGHRAIGLLIPEVARDVEAECRDEIEAALWDWAWPKLRRGLTAGLPEWYKGRLLDSAFSAP